MRGKGRDSEGTGELKATAFCRKNEGVIDKGERRIERGRRRGGEREMLTASPALYRHQRGGTLTDPLGSGKSTRAAVKAKK